jgi:hypothetical protein
LTGPFLLPLSGPLKTRERTRVAFVRNWIGDLRSRGHSIFQIAEITDLHHTTVTDHLDALRDVGDPRGAYHSRYLVRFAARAA